jgi:hypothetical protein
MKEQNSKEKGEKYKRRMINPVEADAQPIQKLKSTGNFNFGLRTLNFSEFNHLLLLDDFIGF